MRCRSDNRRSHTRRTICSVILLVLSALAVILAATPGSVSVYRPEDLEIRAFSFFDQIPGTSMGLCLLLAALASCLCVSLSVADLIFHKEEIRTGLMALSMASMTLDVLPLLAEKTMILLPNMLHPLLMGAVCGGTYLLRRLEK